MPLVLAKNGPLLNLITKKTSPINILYSIKCLEACTEISDSKTNAIPQMQLAIKIFTSYLQNTQEFDDVLYCKVCIAIYKSLF